MELNTFIDHLERLGADLDRWPGEARAAAEALMDRCPAAAAVFTEATRLDDALAKLPARLAPAHLAASISAAARELQQAGGGPASAEHASRHDALRHDDRLAQLGDWFADALWRPALAAGIALGLGFLIGILQTPMVLEDALAGDLSLLPFSPVFEELPYAE